MDSTSQQIVILNLEVNEGDKKNYFRFLLHGKDVEYVTIDPAVYDANVTVFPRGLLPQLPPFPAGDWNAGRIELVPESCKATFLSTEREEPIRYAPGDAVEKWLLEVLIGGCGSLLATPSPTPLFAPLSVPCQISSAAASLVLWARFA